MNVPNILNISLIFIKEMIIKLIPNKIKLILINSVSYKLFFFIHITLSILALKITALVLFYTLFLEKAVLIIKVSILLFFIDCTILNFEDAYKLE